MPSTLGTHSGWDFDIYKTYDSSNSCCENVCTASLPGLAEHPKSFKGFYSRSAKSSSEHPDIMENH